MRRPYLLIRAAAVAAIVAVAGCSADSPVEVEDDDSLPGPTDTIPPTVVIDPGLMLSTSGDTVHFAWTAPHDDTPDDRVHHYEIRFAFSRGFPPVAFWDVAPIVSNPPAPAAPGSLQNHRFTFLESGKDMWVGIASYDSAGNRSPESDLATVYVPGLELLGRCVDGFSGVPVAGLHVRVTSTHVQNFVTDAAGEFRAVDLVAGATSVEVETGAAADVYHRMSETFFHRSDVSRAFVAVPARPTLTPELGGMSMLAFFKMLTGTFDPPRILAKWHTYPVRCYVPPYVNGAGVDYEEISKRAAQRWMDRSGRELFTFVNSPPDTGIVVVYRSPAEISPLIGVTYHREIDNLHPILDEIHIVNSFTQADTVFLYRVMMHEFGHTIAFGHVNASSLIMKPTQSLPRDISDDEANAVILHYAMPTRIDMSGYDESFPTAAAWNSGVKKMESYKPSWCGSNPSWARSFFFVGSPPAE
jgi:hypothetical protein